MNILRHLNIGGDKNKNNKLMSCDDDKLLEKYNTIWTKIESLKNTELDI